MFGVVGDILKIGTATISDGTGGVLGAGGSGQFAILGYNSLNGNVLWCICKWKYRHSLW